MIPFRSTTIKATKHSIEYKNLIVFLLFVASYFTALLQVTVCIASSVVYFSNVQNYRKVGVAESLTISGATVNLTSDNEFEVSLGGTLLFTSGIIQ